MVSETVAAQGEKPQLLYFALVRLAGLTLASFYMISHLNKTDH